MNALELRRRTLGKGVYKKTVEGNPAIAQGSLARRYPGITMQGWMEQDSTTGAQLFDENTVLKDVVIEQDGTLSSGIGYYTSDFIKINPSTTYRITYTGSKRGKFFDENKQPIKTDTYSDFNPEYGTMFVTPTNAAYIRFSGLSNGIQSVMLNEGSSSKPWEPYTGGAPSPSPDYPQEIVNAGNYDEGTQKYQCEVKLTGKNLFDKMKCSNADAWKLGINYHYIAIPVPKGAKVSFSYAEKPPAGLGFYLCMSKKPGKSDATYKWLYHTNGGNLINNSATFTSESNEIYLSLADPSKNIEKVMQYIGNSLQIEVSDVPTEYQPYEEQTVTLTSDRPITKWDKLEKRNGQWGWVYKSAEIVLDGSEEEAWELSQTDNYNQFYIRVDTLEHSNAEKNVYCKKFRPAVIADRETEKEIIYTVRAISGAIAVSTELATELDAWKTWLQSNPITVLYRSIEETFVPLSESEQEQMNELYTFRPTTVLSNDCECEMTLTYKTKKSLEVTT